MRKKVIGIFLVLSLAAATVCLGGCGQEDALQDQNVSSQVENSEQVDIDTTVDADVQTDADAQAEINTQGEADATTKDEAASNETTSKDNSTSNTSQETDNDQASEALEAGKEECYYCHKVYDEEDMRNQYGYSDPICKNCRPCDYCEETKGGEFYKLTFETDGINMTVYSCDSCWENYTSNRDANQNN